MQLLGNKKWEGGIAVRDVVISGDLACRDIQNLSEVCIRLSIRQKIKV
jgi:hypothetical protein